MRRLRKLRQRTSGVAGIDARAEDFEDRPYGHGEIFHPQYRAVHYHGFGERYGNWEIAAHAHVFGQFRVGDLKVDGPYYCVVYEAAPANAATCTPVASNLESGKDGVGNAPPEWMRVPV